MLLACSTLRDWIVEPGFWACGAVCASCPRHIVESASSDSAVSAKPSLLILPSDFYIRSFHPIRAVKTRLRTGISVHSKPLSGRALVTQEILQAALKYNSPCNQRLHR